MVLKGQIGVISSLEISLIYDVQVPNYNFSWYYSFKINFLKSQDKYFILLNLRFFVGNFVPTNYSVKKLPYFKTVYRNDIYKKVSKQEYFLIRLGRKCKFVFHFDNFFVTFNE